MLNKNILKRIKGCTKCIYFLILLTLSQKTFSQDLKGHVISDSGTSLELVTVRLFKTDTVISAAVSNHSGYFTIRPITHLPIKLRLTLIGYQQLDTMINSLRDSVFTFKLAVSRNTLKEVTVSSNKPLFERKIDRLIFNTQNSIAALKGDAMDVLAITPLVQVLDNNLSIIGKGSVGVMVNDHMVKLQGEDLVNYLKSIPSDHIANIEIITNPPAKYSAQGNSGLININLKKSNGDFWSGTIRSIYNQTTFATETANANFDLQKKGLSISSSGSFTDGSNQAVERPTIDYTNQNWSGSSNRRDYSRNYSFRLFADDQITKNFDIGTQLIYNKSTPHSVDYTYTYIRDQSSLQLDSTLFGSGLTETFSQNLSANLNSTYKLKGGGKIALDLDLYSSIRDNNRNFDTYGTDATSNLIPGSEWLSDNIGHNSFKNFSANLDITNPTKYVFFDYGIDYLNSKNTNELNSLAVESNTDTLFHYDDLFSFTESTEAAFISGYKEFSKKWNLQVGFRAENTDSKGVSTSLIKSYTYNYFNVFPTLYSQFHINENDNISFSYGERIDRPSYLSLNPFQRYINQFYYNVGNPYLQPSYTHNFEIDYYTNHNVTISIYETLSNNVVAQTAIPQNSTKVVIDTMQNFYRSSTAGVTVIYGFNKLKWLESMNVINGFYRNIIEKDPQTVPNSSDFTFYFNTTNTVKFNKSLSVQVSYYFISPQVMGIYHQSAKSDLSAGLRYSINKHLETAVYLNDIFKDSQARLSANVNGINEFYNNYYDNRYLRLTVSYRFGNSSITSKQRNQKNDTEKQRAF